VAQSRLPRRHLRWWAVVALASPALTAAALLARQGLRRGSCWRATCQKRRLRPGTFPAGGLHLLMWGRPGGWLAGRHYAVCFRHLGLPAPAATPLDPGCVVDLGRMARARRIKALARDPGRWQQERQQQFPGSDPFWNLCDWLHQASLGICPRDPVPPPRTSGTVGQLRSGRLRQANLPAACWWERAWPICWS